MRSLFQYFFIIFTVMPSLLYSMDVDQNTSSVPILKQCEVFLDSYPPLSKKEVEKQQFHPIDTDVINLGISPNSTLWVRCRFTNTTSKPLTKTLENENSEIEQLTIYDGNKTILEGQFYKQASAYFTNPNYTFTLQPNESKTLLLSAHSEISNFIVKLVLWNTEDFIHYAYKHLIIIFSFFAIILTLLLYNLILYFFTLSKVYLYYVLYLIGVLFFESCNLGIAQLYFFNDALNIFITKGTMTYIVLLVMPMILFTMEFLNTKRFAKIHFWLKFYLYLLPIIALLSYDNILFDLNTMVIFLPLSILMISAGVYAYLKGTTEAIVYLLGWSFIIISLTLSVLQSLGMINLFEHFRYINEVAFALETFIFSIALAYRIKNLNKQKEILNEQLLVMQKSEQLRLQNLVEQQTHKLQASLEEKEILFKELQHRVKNNLSMVISLLELQIHNAVSQDTQKELTITCNRINSFAKLYELLYLNENSIQIPTRNYFEEIVKTIEVNFNKHVDVLYDIRINISLQDSIYCGLILNELVTNSFKYAFEKTGFIEISVYKEDDTIYMSVYDNGKGYTQQPNGSSLGLTIVETLSKKQLRANLSIENTKGTRVTLSWEEKQ